MLTLAEYSEAARTLGVEREVIEAVAEVEAPDGGFLPDGRIAILFERHHFSKYTARRYDRTHPQISSRRRGGYYGKSREWLRYEIASALDAEAARLSTSWGKFQILGSNFELCGYESSTAMVKDLHHSEGAQLLAFCNFVEARKLTRYLRVRNFVAFAEGYNGPAHAKHDYAGRMLKAYRRKKRAA